MANQAILAKIDELLDAPSCCAELKEAAKNYLDAAGTGRQKEAADAFVSELGEDVQDLADTRAFFASEMGAKVFGPEKAKEMTAMADAKLAAGETVCFCAACRAGKAILDSREALYE